MERILVTYFAFLLEILINRHEMTETRYRNNQKCAWTKKTKLFNVAVCNNVHYTHKYRIRYF